MPAISRLLQFKRTARGIPSAYPPSNSLKNRVGVPQIKRINTRKVVVVEGDESVRVALCRALALESYEVLTLDCFRAAAELISAHEQIVALVLDLDLPDALEGQKQMRLADRAGRRPAVIGITTRQGKNEFSTGIIVDALLEKPFDMPLLLEALEGLVAERTPASCRESASSLKNSAGNARCHKLGWVVPNVNPGIGDGGKPAQVEL